MMMMMRMPVSAPATVVVVLLIISLLVLPLAVKDAEATTTVVLVGATGNLAQKYLFQALFDAYVRSPDIRVFAGGRADKAEGVRKVSAALAKLACTHTIDESLCTTMKDDFASLIDYVKLRTAKDYGTIGPMVTQSGISETQRIYYLSIPSTSYKEVASWINAVGRPREGIPLKVVLEKPFGRDYHSSKALHEALSTSLAEDEIYRIDHYLGKRGVQQIPSFKAANRALFSRAFTAAAVSRVDIVMTETDDCRGRTRFYNQYGIVRDVLQNHLTEILVLTAMEAAPHEAVDDFKAKLITEIAPVNPVNAVLGQYSTYADHVHEDHSEASVADAPTFAAVSVAVNNNRWKGVPFVILAGKRMPERRAYVRINFRPPPGDICVKAPCDKYIEFQIQGAGGPPCVTLAGDFPDAVLPFGWHLAVNSTSFVKMCPDSPEEPVVMAYSLLLEKLIEGDKAYFVTSPYLLRMWQIWEPLLASSEGIPLRLYQDAADVDVSVSSAGKVAFVLPDAGPPKPILPRHQEL